MRALLFESFGGPLQVTQVPLDTGTARVDLTVVAAGQKVLMKAQAVVRLD